MTAPLRLLIFDRTCRGPTLLPGLSHAWGGGSALYRALGRIDASHGAASWGEALAWLASVEPSRPIAQIQYWGHGRWGRVLLDGDPLTVDALEPGHAHHDALRAIRERLAPGEAPALWLRTCEAFGAQAGHTFASAWARFLDRRVAGHTFVIGFWQSGLHTIAPGETPSWPADEGLAEGTAQAPERAAWSGRSRPHTVSCLAGAVPGGW
jgi:hypothetical protein